MIARSVGYHSYCYVYMISMVTLAINLLLASLLHVHFDTVASPELPTKESLGIAFFMPTPVFRGICEANNAKSALLSIVVK